LSAVDSAAVVLDGGGRRYTIPRALVQQLEVRRHRGRAGRALGFGLLGGVAGAVVGGAIGYQATKSAGGEDPGSGVFVGVPLGGLVGLIAGAATGANTGGRWVPASLPGPAAPRAAATPPGATRRPRAGRPVAAPAHREDLRWGQPAHAPSADQSGRCHGPSLIAWDCTDRPRAAW
jgi:hypothetical protein